MKQTAFLSKLRFLLPTVTAFLLAGISWLDATVFPLEEFPKGSVATHTIRATHDAVFDLHETFRAEAKEAKQSYIPIYNRDSALPYSHQQKIIDSALAEPVISWDFPEVTELLFDGGPGDGGGSDATGPDMPAVDAGRDRDSAQGDSSGADARGGDARIDSTAGPRLHPSHDEHRREIEAIIRGCFRLLETYYRDGVVGDSEYPREKHAVRIFRGNTYNRAPVSKLHRFSSLRRVVERRAAQIFFKTDSRVRKQVVNYILQRLPPNLTYSRENKKFINDISQVTGIKIVLIRRGDIMVRRGQVVDTRAYYAIRASVRAAAETSWLGRGMGKLFLLLALMLMFRVASQEVAPTAFRSQRVLLVTYCGIVLLVLGGDLALRLLPLHAAILPQAALALILAVVLGRVPGLLAGIILPCCLIITQVFDLSTLLVGTAGGVTAALTVRRRRRGSALAAGVLVGLAQAIVFEACRALEGRPRTYEELWAAGQAFGGGLFSGLTAVLTLPFVERLIGRSSRGKLKELTDYNHPLVRQLREQAPGTFAHTVNLINMVELATEAVEGDRLLAHAGTLFHDIGKIKSPLYFRENQRQGNDPHVGLSPAESAQKILVHVEHGLEIAREHDFPPDVSAFIAEHHGTTGMDHYLSLSRESGENVDLTCFRFTGPKPQTIETAILMLADSLDAASRTLGALNEEAISGLVDTIIFKKLSEFQFDECGINQGDLKRIKEAFVIYLTKARGAAR